MESFEAIRSFLAAVRARIRQRTAARVLLLGAAALALALLVFPLLAGGGEGRAAGLQAAFLAAVTAVILGSLAAGVVLPRRRYRRDAEVARFVGEHLTPVASDLLSAVELEEQLQREGEALPFSPDLAGALAHATADRLSYLDPDDLVPGGAVKRAAQAFVVAAALHALLAVLFPGRLAEGWRRLLVAPSRSYQDDMTLVSEPIVGDITITYEYPAYTGRAPVTVPASSGDVLAPRGTRVTLETTALQPAVRARLVFDGEGAPDPVELKVDGRRLYGGLVVDRPGAFRFRLDAGAGRAMGEAEPHHLEVEPDRAPRVELFAPADELEVSSQRRVELAYSVEDDYGISEIALVWQAPGRRDERKVLPGPKKGARASQAKMIWDLADVPLDAGGRVAYRLEARDNDDVSGPNVGSSRTFYLRVFSPRERHEDLLRRQQQIFEGAIANLADRLVLAGDLDPQRAAQGAMARLVEELTSLLALLEKDPLTSRKLPPELEAMRGRLDKLAREEAPLLAQPAGKERRLGHNGKTVGELEKDVLLLDDWLQRQKLEEILSITDEIRQHRDKLKQLLEDYQRTRSEQVRQEIEREMKALERRIAELEAKLRQLGGDVEDRFVNADAMDAHESADCLTEVRRKLDAGDVKAAQAQLARCSAMLDRQAQALESGLRGLRGEKWSEEEKAYAELMTDVAELEEQENAVASEADQVMDEIERRAAEQAAGKANPARDKARKLADKLKKQLAEVPREGLTPFGQEELDHLSRRVEDVGRMLEEGDLAEARNMGDQAAQSLGTLGAEIDDDLADGEGWSDHTPEAHERLTHAAPTLKELREELERATPSSEEAMSGADRKKLEELARRQNDLQGRARRLAQKAGKRVKEMPGRAAEVAQRGLEEAGDQMGRARERFGAADPSEGRDQARGAAEKLAALRHQMSRAARPSVVGGQDGRGFDDEPVKIPGSEEYKPPEEFREDILEAMKKEKAPDAYREQVKRYYEELVK